VGRIEHRSGGDPVAGISHQERRTSRDSTRSRPACHLGCRQVADGRGYVFGRGRAGFVGWSSAKRALDERIAAARQATGIAEPMSGWTLHDLRRVVSTAMHDRLGIAPHIVEATLGHVGHKAGVAGTYNKAEYLAERRRALEKWAAFLDEIVTGKQPAAKVVQLRK
jgi:hypothetical protein